MDNNKKQFSFNIIELKKFFSSIKDPVFIFNKKNIMLFMNSPAELLTGYSTKEIVNRKISELFETDDLYKLNKADSSEYFIIKKKNGEMLKVSMTSVISESDELNIFLVNQSGNKDEILTNDNLIKVLERSYDFLQSVMDNANPIIVIDPLGFILLINKSFLLTSDYSSSEVIGKSIGEILSGDIIDIFRKSPEDVLKVFSSTSFSEAEMMKKNGVKAIVELNFNPLINDGNIVSIVCSLNDVTEKKKDEGKINKLLLAIENSPATVVITDSSGNIEYVNPKFSRITGYSFEEAVGKNPSVLKSGTQGVEFYKELWETILSGKEWRGEFHNKRKDGSLYWEFASISSIKNKNNEITSFIAVKEDITQRKIIEENLKISEEKLRIKNQSMQQDLNYAQMIIKDILPSSSPDWDRLKVEFRYIPLDAIGGDFFWFYNLADGTPAVYLGDVSGHGVSAALFLSMVKAVSDSLLPKYGYNPGKYIHALNRHLYNNMFSYFLTALYGVFDFSTDNVKFSFSKGGHQPPIIYREKEKKVFSIPSKGKPIALFENDFFDEISVDLYKGDRVFLYTDGLVEVNNKSMEMLDQEGLEKIIMSNYYPDLNKSLEYILSAVQNFMGKNKAQDDIIIIAIELI